MVSFTKWRSLVDGEEISAIPDEGLVHSYDSQDEADGGISTFNDRAGGNNLSGGGEVVSDGINGLQSVYVDDTQRFVGDAVPLGDGDEYTVAGIFEIQTMPEQWVRIITNGDDDGWFVTYDDNADEINLSHAGIDSAKIAEPLETGTEYIFVGTYDGSDATLEVDGLGSETNTQSIDAPTGDLELNSKGDGEFTDQFLGEFWVYEVFKDASQRQEIIDSLNERWSND